MNEKLRWAVIIIAILAIGGLAYYQIGMKESRQYAEDQEQKQGQKQELNLPPPTGNTDDAINAILQEALAEENMIEAEEEDIGLLDLDSRAISDLGQSYDIDEF